MHQRGHCTRIGGFEEAPRDLGPVMVAVNINLDSGRFIDMCDSLALWLSASLKNMRFLHTSLILLHPMKGIYT